MALLELHDVHTYYGAIHALRGVTMTVDEGEIVTLIGSNGAGKSTTLRTISGLLKPRQGEIRLRGDRIDRPAPRDRRDGRLPVARGATRLLPHVGPREPRDGRLLAARQGRDRRRLRTGLRAVPAAAEREAQKAGTLSGGEQQMLAIGRALMSAPKVLLLDEPSMGLAPILVEQIFDIIKTINEQGTTVLLVEQNALMALAIANRGYILQTGEIVLSDGAAALAQNPAVREAYLGGD